MKKGKIFIISGPSGVGKSTIIKNLLANKKLNLFYSISMTTRTKREQEKNGEHYWFVNKKTFQEAIKNNDLLEWAEYAGNYYGTPKSIIYEKLDEGFNVLLEIEVQGALEIMKKFASDIVSIFILPKDIETIYQRLKDRGTDSKQTITKRISIANDELLYKDKYDHQVINDDLKKTIKSIKKIIKRAK